MKKLLVIVFLISAASYGQSTEFGLKGGLNYGSTGDVEGLNDVPNPFSQNDADDKVGYHIGFYSKFKFAGLFLQPELYYTRLSSDYGNSSYNVNKLDLPVLAGINIIGPLHVKAGPAFQYILNNEFEDNNFEVEDPENSITVGYHLGVGVQLGRLGVDVRYEGAFSENTAVGVEDVGSAGFTVDNRPSQFLFGVTYRLSSDD
ncbi:outer membrane beta-barrel protein [Croceiramulus getboli]|nr:outer membrane beta-barrel protein [Flavobacteriaceae bacterium YJPT1-3]